MKSLLPADLVFEVEMKIKDDYFGSLSLTVTDHIYNLQQERLNLVQEQKIQFTRTKNKLIQHHGYIIKTEL